jgi:hypothetical protein
MDSERIGSNARRASSLRSLGETAGCFGQARGDAAIEIDSSWWLNRGDHFLDDVFLAVTCDLIPPGEHVPKKARKGFGFVVAEGDVLHRVDSGGQPLQELEWLVFGDVGVVQDEGEFVAKNFHARIRPTSRLPADVEK